MKKFILCFIICTCFPISLLANNGIYTGKIEIQRIEDAGNFYFLIENNNHNSILLGSVYDINDDPNKIYIKDAEENNKILRLEGNLVKDGDIFVLNDFNLVINKNNNTKNNNINKSNLIWIYGFFINDSFKNILNKCIKSNYPIIYSNDNRVYDNYNKYTQEFHNFIEVKNPSTLGINSIEMHLRMLGIDNLPGIKFLNDKNSLNYMFNFDGNIRFNNKLWRKDINVNYIQTRNENAFFYMYFLTIPNTNIDNLLFFMNVSPKDKDVGDAIKNTLTKRYKKGELRDRGSLYNFWSNNSDIVIAREGILYFYSSELLNMFINYNIQWHKKESEIRESKIYEGM